MADVTLTYKGATIAELSDSGSKTLQTAGRFCEANIGLEYTKPSGGGNDLVGLVERTLTTFENSEITNVGRSGFAELRSLTSVSLPNAITIRYNGFNGCSNLVQYNLPNVTTLEQNSFGNCNKLPHLVFPKVNTIPVNCFISCWGASAGDFGATSIAANTFRSCERMNILILRSKTLVPIGGMDTFANTPFYSGKAGGTIYIPKMLYDHLGDGSAQDYKAATNWATYDGYGTITWAPIEGSIYETQYADGTPIT